MYIHFHQSTENLLQNNIHSKWLSQWVSGSIRSMIVETNEKIVFFWLFLQFFLESKATRDVTLSVTVYSSVIV